MEHDGKEAAERTTWKATAWLAFCKPRLEKKTMLLPFLGRLFVQHFLVALGDA
jgi:hypothetical protein